MENDWRIFNQENYLLNRKLKKIVFPACYDHAHCAFCWGKFGSKESAEYMRVCYCTLDEQHWICEQCFDDFQDRFKWTVQDRGQDRGRFSVLE